MDSKYMQIECRYFLEESKTITLPEDIKQLKISYEGGDVRYSLDGRVVLVEDDIPYITVNYIKDIYKGKNCSVFSTDLMPGKKTRYIISLPYNYKVVAEESSLPSQVYYIGRNRQMVWEDLHDPLNIRLCFLYMPEQENFQYIWLFYLVFLLALFKIFKSVYRGKNLTKIDIIKESLPDDEKRVIVFLYKNGGYANQKEIQEYLKLDKFEVSKIIKRLYDRRLIIKRKKGRTNKIELDPWLLQ